MKPALAILLGIGAADLAVLNLWVAPELLAREPAPVLAPAVLASAVTSPSEPLVAAPPTPAPRRVAEREPHAERPPAALAPAPSVDPPADPPAPSIDPPAPSAAVSDTATPGARAAGAPAGSLSPLYFGYDRATIFPASAAILDRVAEEMARDPALTLVVIAHASAAGASDHNDALSRRRGERVKDHLRGRGIVSSRVEVVARGELDADPSRPDTRRDRRVDLALEVRP